MFPSRSVIALAIALATISAGPSSAAAWITTSMPWTILPSMKVAGRPPQTFIVPSKAWTYGASSANTEVFAKTEAVVLRVDLTVAAGRVGVSLMSPDGATLLSKERVLTPQNEPAHVYFRIVPTAKPSVIVIRNYDDEGRQGSVTVNQSQFVRDADLSNEELTVIVKEGIL